MRHPNQAALALHAGGDLGALARWRMERHVSRCEECRAEIAQYREMLSVVPDLAETPEVSWNRLAAEMKANIRLGLAAGECVRTTSVPERRRMTTGFRAAVAFASLVALISAVLRLEQTGPLPADQPGIIAEAAPGGAGIQMRQGKQALRLLGSGAHNITFTAGAQGSMEARYVDGETGYITVNKIDVN